MSLGKDKLIYDSTDTTEGDSVAAFLHASNKLTSTTIAGIEALDVNIAGSTGLGIFDEDTAHTTGDKGQFILVVRNDTPGSLVDTDGDYAPLQVDANGRLRVDAEVSVSSGSDKIEDSASANGDVGTFILGVRQDSLVSSVSADGDYGAFKFDALGQMWSRAMVYGDVADDGVDSGNPVKVGQRAVSGALAAVSASGDRADQISDLYRRQWVNTAPNIAASNAAVSVDTTVGGVALFASPLAGRRHISIQNLGTKAIFVGQGTVTAANGTRIAAGATYDMDLGPDIALKAIAESGTQDTRVLQLA